MGRVKVLNTELYTIDSCWNQETNLMESFMLCFHVEDETEIEDGMFDIEDVYAIELFDISERPVFESRVKNAFYKGQ